MAIVRTFYSNVKDRFGWTFDDCFVAIRLKAGSTAFADEATTESIDSNVDSAMYASTTKIDSIVYTLNFWYTRSHQLQGYASQPVFSEVAPVDESDKSSWVLDHYVNIESLKVQEVINDPLLSFEDKVIKGIEVDHQEKNGYVEKQ